MAKLSKFTLKPFCCCKASTAFWGDKTEHCFRINVLIMTGMHFGAVCRRQLFLTEGIQY